MQFHELFLEVRAAEVKDLEYCSLLSRIRECYEEFLSNGQNNPEVSEIINRIENMTFTVNMNDFVGLMNVNQTVCNFDYACEFNPSQKRAISLLLSVISAPQEGEYIKGFFALYIWQKLLPDVRFYSVGLMDNFYALAGVRDQNGECKFKPAREMSQIVAEQKTTAFFNMKQDEHCDESQALIAEIDKALHFIVNKYAA
ncbi:hypothetical protein [Wohlfahrtiimonas larvae]|uniref:Uncharacterized protein n=1 Tax=Wohlfahrtiimonas larvae TaxID=1157986 RepID=A0ABP9MTB7_9GAMM|nr:hypothetical protein [Wohlfahrtiimonas larvae]